MTSNPLVQCGKDFINWGLVVEAVGLILRPPPRLTQMIPHQLLPFLGAERIQNIALQGDKLNILDVLRQTRYAKCKDPRDR